MREIKFRSWNGKTMQFWGFNIGGPMDPWFVGPQQQEIDSEYPAMQFTGLKDKNGREIFEGDLIQLPGSLRLVTYKDCSFHLDAFLAWKGVGDAPCTPLWMFLISKKSKDFEVIGNIYETQELVS